LLATTNKLPFVSGQLVDFEGDEPHFRIVRLFVDERAYNEE